MTNNLGAPQVADNQSQKEQTINDAVGRLDAALTDVLAVTITTSNAAVVTATDFKAHAQFDIGTAGATAASTLTVPAGIRKGLFVVTNGLGYAVTVGVLGQAGTWPSVADSAIGLFFCDGATVRAL